MLARRPKEIACNTNQRGRFKRDMTQFAKPIGLARPDEIALRDPLQALTWLEIDNILNRAANAIRVADLARSGEWPSLLKTRVKQRLPILAD